MVPGSRELAEATVRVLAERDAAVWACHGLFVGGTDFDGAFGLMHTVEKAAEILVKVLSMGGKRQTAGPEDLRALSRTYGLGLSEEFLYEK